jgi:predicted secreted protein
VGWVSGIVVFLLIWWTMIFCVLPWGLRRDETGKPEMPRLRRKFLITTGLSFFLWLGIYALIETDIISFREIAKGMAQEDYK